MPNKRGSVLPAYVPDDPRVSSITRMLNLLTSDPGRADAKPIMMILANLIARYPADDREKFLASAPTRLCEMVAARDPHPR